MRRSSSDTSGFSLIELTIYCALLLFLMGGIYLLLSSGMRYFQTGSVYQTTQQQVFVGLRKLGDELMNSTRARRSPDLAVISDADHLIFLSPETPYPDPTGDWLYQGASLQYQKWVCYYHDAAARELRRSEQTIAPVTSTNAPPAPTLLDMQAAGLPNQVIARSVVDFNVNDGATADIIRVDLTAENATGGSNAATERVTRIRMETEVRQAND